MQFLMGGSKSEVPVPTSVCEPDIEKNTPWIYLWLKLFIINREKSLRTLILIKYNFLTFSPIKTRSLFCWIRIYLTNPYQEHLLSPLFFDIQELKEHFGQFSCPVGWHSGTKTPINAYKCTKQNLQESVYEIICRQYLIYYVVAPKPGTDNFQR